MENKLHLEALSERGSGRRKRDVFCMRPRRERGRRGDKLSKGARESGATESEHGCI